MLKLLVRARVQTTDGSTIYKEYPLDKVKVLKANRDDDLDDNAPEEIKEILD
jgi:hypothetical protein